MLGAQVVTPGYVRVVKGEGMPKSKQPGQKGDLRIVFDVQVRPSHSQAHIHVFHTSRDSKLDGFIFVMSDASKVRSHHMSI